MLPLTRVDDENRARALAAHLTRQGIPAQADPNSMGGWTVWVLDQHRLEDARALLAELGDRPLAPPPPPAAAATGAPAAERPRSTPVTWTVIAASVAMALHTEFGAALRSPDPADVRDLARYTIADFQVVGGRLVFDGLSGLRDGQLWRLFTPALLHFGIAHLLFNMLWIRDLGGMIERRASSRLLLAQILAIGVLANIGQYLASGDPLFGGMSGVVYGLVGYVWTRGRRDPASGLAIDPLTMAMLLVWFVVCLTGLMGPVGNAAHAVGLAVGAAWGRLAPRRPPHAGAGT